MNWRTFCGIEVWKHLVQRNNWQRFHSGQNNARCLWKWPPRKKPQQRQRGTKLSWILKDNCYRIHLLILKKASGLVKWPRVLQLQIAEFILTIDQGKDSSKRLLSNYKQGKAYSYFDSRWLGEVFYHEITPTQEVCFLKSKSRPSQKIKNVLHKIWVCVNRNNGTVEGAYCTCFAGLGSKWNIPWRMDWH